MTLPGLGPAARATPMRIFVEMSGLLMSIFSRNRSLIRWREAFGAGGTILSKFTELIIATHNAPGASPRRWGVPMKIFVDMSGPLMNKLTR